jgi:endonuclease-8
MYPVSVTDIGTKGKFLFVELSNGYYIFITHGMSGTWVTDKEISSSKYTYGNPKHHRLEFVTPRGSLYFNDYRNFGTVHVITEKSLLAAKLDELGPDILDDNITRDMFFGRMKPNKKIGMLLMDQKVISGIGNYLRAEILWYARISPHRLYKDMTEGDKDRLFDAAYNIVRYHSIRKKSKLLPSMNRSKLEYILNITPKDADFFVYRQEVDYYGGKVKSEKMGERTVHWVPEIQK